MQTTLENNEAQDQGAAEPAAGRTCRACAAPMQEDQDWCLTCGTAAPGRLGGRPGWRTVNSVAAVTLVLIVGAFSAGYAALSGDANTDASKPPPASAEPLPGQQAQIPDAALPPGTVPPGAVVPPAVTPPAGATPETKSPTIPGLPAATPGAPALPTAPATPVAPPTGATPGTGGDTGTGTDTGEDTTPDEPAKPVTLTEIELGDDAASLYEPSKRSTRAGEPANAYDGKPATAWSVTTPDDTFPMQVGLLIDLEKARNVKQIELSTNTPGGRIEVYGAVGSAVPPDILDTRWEHVASQSKVDAGTKGGNVKGDKKDKIRLPGPGATGSRFRYVLLWFTTPPTAGPTVRISELTLKG